MLNTVPNVVRGLEVVATHPDAPEWAIILMIANIITFSPLILLMTYTWGKLLPTLAALEDEVSEYEMVRGESEDEDVKALLEDPEPIGESSKDSSSHPHHKPEKLASPSIHALHALVRRQGGWQSLFRGLPCYIALASLASIQVMISDMVPVSWAFIPIHMIFLPFILQVQTVWVHQVSTRPSPQTFLSRMPSFTLTLRAAFIPALLNEAMVYSVFRLQDLAAKGLDIPKQYSQFALKMEEDSSMPAKVFVLLLVTLLSACILILPSVILARILASTLPANEDTIVPFDRSFGGRVQSVGNGGRGYATIVDAWSSLSGAAWGRVVKVYLKLNALVVVAMFGIFIVFWAQGRFFSMIIGDEAGEGQ